MDNKNDVEFHGESESVVGIKCWHKMLVSRCVILRGAV